MTSLSHPCSYRIRSEVCYIFTVQRWSAASWSNRSIIITLVGASKLHHKLIGLTPYVQSSSTLSTGIRHQSTHPRIRRLTVRISQCLYEVRGRGHLKFVGSRSPRPNKGLTAFAFRRCPCVSPSVTYHYGTEKSAKFTDMLECTVWDAETAHSIIHILRISFGFIPSMTRHLVLIEWAAEPQILTVVFHGSEVLSLKLQDQITIRLLSSSSC